MHSREPCFDLVKVAMMLWVVWGHLGLYGIVEAEPLIYMANAKIGVNMPVFFVMSGYFAASTFTKKGWSDILARAGSYVWPHVTIPIVSAMLWVVVFNMDLRSALGNVHLYWFLRTLALVYLLCALIYRLVADDKWRWFLFALTYLAMIFCPTSFRFWWCGQVIHMYPYFVFGLMVLRRHRFHLGTRVSLCCGVVFISAVMLGGDFISTGMNFWESFPYWESVFGDVKWFITFFARTAVGITDSIFVLFAAEFLVKRIPCIQRLAPMGLTSLGVYVVHEYPLILINKYAALPPAPAWSRWIIAIGWFLACHFTVRLIQHCKVSNFFFFGDEAWMKNVLSKLSNRFYAQ